MTTSIKVVFFTILFFLMACSNSDSLELEKKEESSIVYSKLTGNWSTVAFTETIDCDSYIDKNIVNFSPTDNLEIDSEGNYTHMYDDDGTSKTGYGKFIYISQLDNVYKFQFTSEFTTAEDEVYHYYIFSDNIIRYYGDECINDNGRSYIEGVILERI